MATSAAVGGLVAAAAGVAAVLADPAKGFYTVAERGGEVLCRAEVTAVCIHLDGRPRRPTPELVAKVKPWLIEA